jgi:hypothetical protein
MGLVADPSGISVQLYDDQNQPLGNPVFGKFTHLCSVDRRVRTNIEPLTTAETKFPGSKDWLTEVVVADTPERLEALAPAALQAQVCAFSSCASHRVSVLLHVGNDDPKRIDGCTVIASGPVVPRKPTPEEPEPPKEPQVRVVHVKAFDPGVEMDESHPMIDEFNGWASELNALSV